MVAAVMFGNVAVFAQTGAPVNGRVTIKDADGKATPVANALVDVYRLNTNGKLTSDKTNKKGEFSFAAFQFGAVFALVISGEGIDPAIFPNVRAGATNLDVVVTAGSGRVLTEQEVREQLATAASGDAPPKPSEEDTKKAEEIEKERLRIAAKNENAIKFNETSKTLLEEGKTAFEAKNFDVAIAKFDEGYKLNPEFLGTAPTFLNNKATALAERGAAFQNKGAIAQNEAQKKGPLTDDDKRVLGEIYAKGIADFNAGVDTFYTSWTMLKNASAAEQAANSTYQENKMLALSGARLIFSYAVQAGRTNPEKLDKAKELLEEYVKIEPDAAKQANATSLLANYYFSAGDYDAALAEYRKALTISKNDPGALFGLGITLVSTGYEDDGSPKKPQLQEAANFLKRFMDTSPTNKKMVKDATETLELLKSSGISPK